MTVLARFRPLLLVAAGLFALTACAETQFLVHTAKRVQGVDDGSAGDYKVGKPYQINGQWYYPAEDFEYTETGIASWYGPNFHGRKTANGEDYNMNALTAAHRTLPMPSVVRVTNLENGRAIVLRVNDRGPFARGRIIDVSRRAAQLLGFRNKGTAKVRVEIMPSESRQMKLAAINRGQAAVAELPVSASPREAVVAKPLPLPGGGSSGETVTVADVPADRQVARAAAPELPKQVEVLPVSPTGIFVQAGAFADLGNALRLRDRLYGVGPVQISRFAVSGTEVYRVRMGPFETVDGADKMLARLVRQGLGEARMIVE